MSEDSFGVGLQHLNPDVNLHGLDGKANVHFVQLNLIGKEGVERKKNHLLLD